VRNYITPVGHLKLKQELKRLLYDERPALVKVIQWAASNGDRSENGDYIYGKRRLREIDRRIRFLTQRLESAEIIDPLQQKKDRVLLGASVVVENSEARRCTYRIVGQDEIDPSKGWVSWVAPVAKALLNTRVGDVVLLKTPQGEDELEVLEIFYVAE
jgi:transcription elongation factor GreB